MRPKLSSRQIKRLQQIELQQDFGHAPVLQLGRRQGVVLPLSVPCRQENARNWREWLVLQLKLRWRRRCLFPRSECRAELLTFSAAIARWLVMLAEMDPHDKYSVIGVEKAFVALKTRLEHGVLSYRTDFASLFRFFARQQLAAVEMMACRRIGEHAAWLLDGRGDGVMRSLAWRNEFRRTGFGLFEDLLRHMPAAEFAQLMLEHRELDQTAPELLAWLRNEALNLGKERGE